MPPAGSLCCTSKTSCDPSAQRLPAAILGMWGPGMDVQGGDPGQKQQMSSGSSQLSPKGASWCCHGGFPHFHVCLQPPAGAPSPKDEGAGLCAG